MNNYFYTDSVALDYIDEIRSRLSNSLHVSNFCLDEMKCIDTCISSDGKQASEFVDQIKLAMINIQEVLEELRRLTSDIYSLEKESRLDACFMVMKRLALFTYRQIEEIKFIFSPELETAVAPKIDDHIYFDFLYQCKEILLKGAKVVRVEKGGKAVNLVIVE